MVLVDTSVWIRFLANVEPYASGLQGLLLDEEAVGHDFVYGELLIGDRGGRLRVMTGLAQMVKAETIPHAEVVEFVRARKLHGRGIGWIDVHLLASAVVAGHELWSADPRLAAAAKDLGVAYAPGSS